MRILLIAPDLKNVVIRAHQEALMRDIGGSGVQGTFLQETVHTEDVIRELRTGRYNVLMCMTHGFAQGIQLSDGQVVEPGQLGSLARFGVELVCLLACESVTAAQAMMQAARVDTIGLLTELASDDAYLVGSLFVQAMADGLDYRTAFEKARPGNDSSFIYLSAPPARSALQTPMANTYDDHERRLQAHAAQLAEHAKRLDVHEIEFGNIRKESTFQLRKTDVFFWAVLAVGVSGLLFALVGAMR